MLNRVKHWLVKIIENNIIIISYTTTERGPPGWIFPFAIIIGVAFMIITIGLIYLAVFGTRKGFLIKLWDFYESQKEKEAESLREKKSAKKKDSLDEKAFDNLAYES